MLCPPALFACHEPRTPILAPWNTPNFPELKKEGPPGRLHGQRGGLLKAHGHLDERDVRHNGVPTMEYFKFMAPEYRVQDIGKMSDPGTHYARKHKDSMGISRGASMR